METDPAPGVSRLEYKFINYKTNTCDEFFSIFSAFFFGGRGESAFLGGSVMADLGMMSLAGGNSASKSSPFASTGGCFSALAIGLGAAAGAASADFSPLPGDSAGFSAFAAGAGASGSCFSPGLAASAASLAFVSTEDDLVVSVLSFSAG
jgi:hypothetical protein